MRIQSVAVALALLASVPAQEQWFELAPANSPPPRTNPAMAYDSARGVVVLFGGVDPSTSNALDDTWVWDGVTWTRHAPAAHPRARSEHAMAYDAERGVTVLFGGLDQQSARTPETWEWDGSNWSLRHTMPVNDGRFAFGMTFDSARRRIVVFGGGGPGGLRGDTWSWDGSAWTLLTTAGPMPRKDAGIAYDSVRDRIVLYGGRGDSGLLQDTWEFDGAAWLQRNPSTQPPPLEGHGVAYDSTMARTMMFGGDGASTTMWAFDGHDWTARTPIGNPPGARRWLGMAYDAARSRSVLFGGSTDPHTWEYFATVRLPGSFATYGVGCASSAGIVTLDARSGSLPYVGSPFHVEMAPVPTAAFNVPFAIVGISRTNWSGRALPFELSPLQMPGCHLLAGIEVVLPLPRVGATATLVLAIPNDRSLAGAQVFVQGLVTDGLANPGGMAWSNAGELVIGER